MKHREERGGYSESGASSGCLSSYGMLSAEVEAENVDWHGCYC